MRAVPRRKFCYHEIWQSLYKRCRFLTPHLKLPWIQIVAPLADMLKVTFQGCQFEERAIMLLETSWKQKENPDREYASREGKFTFLSWTGGVSDSERQERSAYLRRKRMTGGGGEIWPLASGSKHHHAKNLSASNAPNLPPASPFASSSKRPGLLIPLPHTGALTTGLGKRLTKLG
jgi:hypothetical protein